ncbi:MAG: SDR family NAD(P)-dependent oxidoreductase [Alphaproteobacteria bacterium]|jgi:NAD(P)-dependent dehydrogenase (short-subunit alcohol dehydrogenase family)
MALDFTGKVAVVTGAGGGLGRSHALALAERGAKVVVNDLGGSVSGEGQSVDHAQKVVDEIVTAGGEAIANTASVSDPAGAQSMIDDAINHFGGIHILINNAGILRDQSFKKASMDDMKLILDVHLMGSVYTTKAAWRIMCDQQYGRVVMTTSPSGLFGNFGQTNYGAAKLGIVGLMNTLAIEGQKKNVFCNAIAPVALTRMTRSLMPQIDGSVEAKLAPEWVTAAVLNLCTEGTKNGDIVLSNGPQYKLIRYCQNAGVTLGETGTAEDLEKVWDQLLDISNMKVRARKMG